MPSHRSLTWTHSLFLQWNWSPLLHLRSVFLHFKPAFSVPTQTWLWASWSSNSHSEMRSMKFCLPLTYYIPNLQIFDLQKCKLNRSTKTQFTTKILSLRRHRNFVHYKNISSFSICVIDLDKVRYLSSWYRICQKPRLSRIQNMIFTASWKFSCMIGISFIHILWFWGFWKVHNTAFKNLCIGRENFCMLQKFYTLV